MIIGRKVCDQHIKINFPITRNVISYGNERQMKLEKGSVVRCNFCNTPIIISEQTCFVFEDMEYVHCNHCNHDVSVLYYFGKELDVV